MLAATDNRTALADLSGHWIDRVHGRKPPKCITLDMDSSVSPTHGAQEGTAWNGHFGCLCYQGTDLPEEMADWSLTSLQTRLIKIGARVVRHARAITFQLAEVAVCGSLFNSILAAIHRLRAPPVPA